MSRDSNAKMRVRSQLLAIGTIVLFSLIAIIFDKGSLFLQKVMNPTHFALLVCLVTLAALQLIVIPVIGKRYFELYDVEPDNYLKRIIPFYNEYILFESPMIGFGYIISGLLTVLCGLLFWFVTPSMLRSIGLGNSIALNFKHTMLLLFILLWLIACIFRGIGYVRVSADVDRANMEFGGCGGVTTNTRATTVVVRSGAVGTFMFILQMILLFVPLVRLFGLLNVFSKLGKLRGVNKYVVGEEQKPQLVDDDEEEEDDEDDYEYERRTSSNRNRRRR